MKAKWDMNVLTSGIAPFIRHDFATAAPDESVGDVLRKFNSTGDYMVFVVEPKTCVLKGVVTPTEITRLYKNQDVNKAEELASVKDIMAIRDNAQVWQVIKTMNGENPLRKRFDTLPVVDAQQRPVGIITRDDLRKKMNEYDVLSSSSSSSSED